MSLRHQIDELDLEDVRFAVVMNGGVSLAIWIGGVAMELDRLAQVRDRVARGEGGITTDDCYWQLLDLTKSTARVDVIAGTSAGGLNGAFLALATVFQRSLAPLGKLWADTGGLAQLLRSPLDAEPPSLLRGDDYFLRELRVAFDTVHAQGGGTWQPPDAVPMTLHITTTLLEGEPRTFLDDFGTHTTELEHTGSFRFFRAPDLRHDDFRDDDLLRARLALAARSTASFPVAFEASYVPVADAGQDRWHPDMHGIANFEASRFVVDGGVLLNKPVRPALEAVLGLPGDRQVRRLLAYVDPHPAHHAAARPARHTQPPTLSRILLDALVTLPRAQSVHAELAELEEHNRRVRKQRHERADLAGTLTSLPHESADLMYESYRTVRIQRAIAHIAHLVATDRRPGGDDSTPGWTQEELVAALTLEADSTDDGLPFVPPSGPLHEVLDEPSLEWRWGIAALERLGAVAVDVLARALQLAPLDDPGLRGRLRDRRREMSKWFRSVRSYRLDDTRFWRSQAGELPTPPADAADRPDILRGWAAASLARWPLSDAEADTQARGGMSALQVRASHRIGMAQVAAGISEVLAQAGPDLEAVVALADPSLPREAQHELAQLASLVPATRSLPRLLHLEVLVALLGTDTVTVEQEVALLHITGETPPSFGPTRAVEEKLAGVKLGHFGAFYKKSWRVNDWIWGRLDGATRIVQGVLAPTRLRQLRLSGEEALELIRTLAVGPADDPDHGYLTDLFPQARCVQELSYLDEGSWPAPPSLPACSLAVARRLHLGILRDELRNLADAVDDDRSSRAASGTSGARFQAAYEAAVARHGQDLPAATVFELFSNARIGEETFEAELGTDLFASTVSTAAAVGVSTVDARRSGLGPLKVITRPLRGLVLLLYALVAGATRDSNVGRAAVTAALAAGGALLSIMLLTEDTPNVVAGTGAALVLAGLGLAALRSQLWQYALLLGLPLAVLVLIAATDPAGIARTLGDNAGTLLVVVGLVLALMLIGTLQRTPGPPPFLAPPGWRPWGVIAIAVLAIVVGFVWTGSWPATEPLVRASRLSLAFDPARAAALMAGWEAAARSAVRAHVTVWGWLLPITVSTALCLVVLWAGQACRRADVPGFRTLPTTLAWGVVFAGVLEIVANGCRVLILRSAEGGGLPSAVTATGTVVAITAWAIWTVAIVYVVGAALMAAVMGTTGWPGRPGPRAPQRGSRSG